MGNQVKTLSFEQFEFKSSLKTFLFAIIGVGLLSLAASYFTDHTEHHTKFWSNVLQNTVFFTGIGFLALFFHCCQILAYAGWYSQFKRVYEAMAMFMIPGLALMVLLLLGTHFGWHHLFHWAEEGLAEKDPLIAHKSAFLNMKSFTLFTVITMLAWIFFAIKMRQASIAEDDMEFGANYKKIKVLAATFLPLGGFSSTAIIWLWIMAIDPHWYSTLFAWYTTASWLVSLIAMIILVLVYLKSKGYYTTVNDSHFHDLGKYLFAFSILWSYLWFSQFLLIWYGNIGEETIYFDTRLKHFKFAFFANLALNFLAPLLILLRNDTKRKFGTLVFTSIIVLLGHFHDYFLMIRPGLYYNLEHHAHESAEAYHHFESSIQGFVIPGVLDLGSMLAFLGVFLYTTFHFLSKAKLIAKNDAYLDESVHHHTV